jgi:hypothetical protein
LQQNCARDGHDDFAQPEHAEIKAAQPPFGVLAGRGAFCARRTYVKMTVKNK